MSVYMPAKGEGQTGQLYTGDIHLQVKYSGKAEPAIICK
jgi:hypothetical protein